ncbi:6287_t:CDS:2 [Entrophospora sp. SA101]|nr:6287_t:CDS:2 [Entrophospora sp. SA101]
MDNLTILTSGNQIYAKKRERKKQQVEKIVFDENARRLTKEAKIKKIAEFYKTTENSIISSSSNVDENLQDKVDEYVEEEKNVKQEIEMKKSEFRTPETLTTVTIINDLDICNFSSISESEYSKNIEKIIEESKKKSTTYAN